MEMIDTMKAQDHEDIGHCKGLDPNDARKLALVIAWSATEPHRVGEIAFCPTSRTALVGRGAEQLDDFMGFGRHRPGEAEIAVEDGGCLVGASISRKQLEVRASGRHLEMRKVGRSATLVNGEERDHAELLAGDTVYLRGEAVLLCVWRSATLRAPRAGHDLHAFGEPDADGLVGESLEAWELRRALARAAERDLESTVFVDDVPHDPSFFSPSYLMRYLDRVNVPTLRSRPEDIPLFARHLLLRRAHHVPDVAKRFFATGPSGALHPRMSGRLVDYLVRHPLHGGVPELDRLLRAAIDSSTEDKVTLPLSFSREEARREPRGLHRVGGERFSMHEALALPPTLPPPSDAACDEERAWAVTNPAMSTEDPARTPREPRRSKLPRHLTHALLALAAVVLLVTGMQGPDGLLAALPRELRGGPAHDEPVAPVVARRSRAALHRDDASTEPCDWPSEPMRSIYCSRNEGLRVA